MPDSVLDFLLAFLPIVLSLVGVWTFEPLSERHKFAWRTGLIVAGVLLTTLTLAQQARQRASAASDARELKEQMIRQAEQGDQREEDLKRNFEAFVAAASREKRSAVTGTPQVPSAAEIAAEVEKQLSAHWPPGSTGSAAAPDKSPVATRPGASPGPTAPPSALPNALTVQPCRGDRLNECTDEQLLEWGKPLVENIQQISDQFSADEKKLDDIKGGKMDWLRDLAGTGGDKDSKWLKGYELANRTATEKFRDCCAERALAYHKEIVERDHTIPEDAELYEWVENLLQPEESKQWKTAREDGSKVSRVYFDLNFFLIHLNYLVSVHGAGH